MSCEYFGNFKAFRNIQIIVPWDQILKRFQGPLRFPRSGAIFDLKYMKNLPCGMLDNFGEFFYFVVVVFYAQKQKILENYPTMFQV